MSGNQSESKTMAAALQGLPDGALHIAQELRLMANAQPPYASFSNMPPMARNVWHAAADYLEQGNTGIKN